MLSGRENIKTRELKIIFSALLLFRNSVTTGYVYREKFNGFSRLKGEKAPVFQLSQSSRGKKETKHSIWKSDAIKIKKLFTTCLDTIVVEEEKKVELKSIWNTNYHVYVACIHRVANLHIFYTEAIRGFVKTLPVDDVSAFTPLFRRTKAKIKIKIFQPGKVYSETHRFLI